MRRNDENHKALKDEIFGDVYCMILLYLCKDYIIDQNMLNERVRYKTSSNITKLKKLLFSNLIKQ